MAQRRTYLDALGAALAVDRLDEDPEARRFEAALRGDLRVLGCMDEMCLCRLTGNVWRALLGGERGDALREVSLGNGDPQDRAVGAGADARHAADASLGDELRQAGREPTEVTDRGRAGWDDAPREADVRGPLLVRHTTAVGRNDRCAELLDVRLDIEQRGRDRELGLVLLLEGSGLLRQWGSQVGGHLSPPVRARTTSLVEMTPIGSCGSSSATTTSRCTWLSSILIAAVWREADRPMVSGGLDMR